MAVTVTGWVKLIDLSSYPSRGRLVGDASAASKFGDDEVYIIYIGGTRYISSSRQGGINFSFHCRGTGRPNIRNDWCKQDSYTLHTKRINNLRRKSIDVQGQYKQGKQREINNIYIFFLPRCKPQPELEAGLIFVKI